MTRRYRRVKQVLPLAMGGVLAPGFRIRTAAHGVTMKATSSENTHRRAGPDRNRPHVGPHQPAHESHRQDRRDHRQRGQNGGIAHFVHGLDGHVEWRPFAVGRHAPVAHDVLHHHDGVVHQDADGKNQREQRDAVQRVAVKIENRQRQGQSHRNGDEHDQRLAKTQRDGDQDAHRDHRDQHVEQQFVGLFRGGFAIVCA